jgi:hypothetical protein
MSCRGHGSGQLVPFVNCDLPPKNLFDFTQHHPKLRHGILFVRGDCETMLLMHHKLVFRAGI